MTSHETPGDAELARFLTVDEVSTMLRVSRATVYRLVSSGALVATRVGHSVRVTRRAVDEFIGHHTRGSTHPPDH